MGRFPIIVATLVGSLLVVTGASLLTGDDTVGSVPEPAGVVTASPSPAAPPSPSPTPPTPSPQVETGPGEEPPAAPTSVSIPTIGVDAAAVPVGLEDDGSMEIPEDVTTVGWYALGVAPGGDGSAVIAGHVDSRTQGRGAFFDLIALEVGDTATVAHDDGTTTTWEVTGRTSYPKDEAPLAELFRRGGPPQLALITCGGEFDAGRRSYEENIVVLLEPAV